MRILLTSIGKRVQLIKHLKSQFEIIGVDANELVPALKFVDKFYKIPKFNNKDYLKTLLNICKIENIDILIPLYELEFDILTKNRNEFEKIGTKLILSNSKIIDICNDKYKTYELLKNVIKCPKVYNIQEINYNLKKKSEKILPLIIKPKNGMGSSNVFKINNLKELKFFKTYVKNPIFQQYIQGEEYTVDVLCDFQGKPIYIIPRKRLEVRSGEVSKSKTIHDELIISETLKVIKEFNKISLKEINLMGPLTIQFFKTNDNNIYFLEINPRFGGGVPLSFKAGANYAKCLKEMINGIKLNYIDNFEEITMLRFDDAIYLK